jgi:hypothetical protein
MWGNSFQPEERAVAKRNTVKVFLFFSFLFFFFLKYGTLEVVRWDIVQDVWQIVA